MSCSLAIVEVAFILFFTNSLPFSKLDLVIAHTPNLLKENCNNEFVQRVVDPSVCLKILESYKEIVSSKNKIDFLIAIIESGISNGTQTRSYMENKLKNSLLDPKLKVALQVCKSSYDLAILNFQSALVGVKARDYDIPSYNLLVASTDDINQCRNVVASNKIKDATLLIGNKVLPMFGFIGFNVANDLHVPFVPPPKGQPTINLRHQVTRA
ncbi:hypothetical protein ACS0TY_006489 [Phlomoides rotata]